MKNEMTMANYSDKVVFIKQKCNLNREQKEVLNIQSSVFTGSPEHLSDEVIWEIKELLQDKENDSSFFNELKALMEEELLTGYKDIICESFNQGKITEDAALMKLILLLISE